MKTNKRLCPVCGSDSQLCLGMIEEFKDGKGKAPIKFFRICSNTKCKGKNNKRTAFIIRNGKPEIID